MKPGRRQRVSLSTANYSRITIDESTPLRLIASHTRNIVPGGRKRFIAMALQIGVRRALMSSMRSITPR